MVVSLLALCVGTITFENPGIRLELFLKEISKQTGVGFHCPTYLNNEVLATSFKDQSIDVLKSQLARVIHGTWEQKDDAWWLVQTSEQKKEESKWVWEARNKELQWQIDGLKSVAPANEWSSADAAQSRIDQDSSNNNNGESRKSKSQLRALSFQTPWARLFARIASKLSVDMFKEDPLKYDTNRYSVRGLAGHIELPINVSDSVRIFERERGLYTPPSYFRLAQRKIEHIEVRIRSIGIRKLLCFTASDKDWTTVSSESPSIYLLGSSERGVEKPELFPLSDETKQVVSLQNELEASDDPSHIHWTSASSKLFVDAASVMLNATKRDPLGIIQGRCWIDFAKAINRPLLVNLSESQKSRFPQVVPAISQDGQESGMLRQDIYGWVLGRPANPLYNRSWRLDRHDIERYANLTKAGATPTFFVQAQKYALAKQASLFSTGIPNDGFLLNKVDSNFNLTSILGTLTESQFNQCLKGNQIPATKLPAIGYELLTIYANEGILNELTPFDVKNFDSLCPLYYLPNGIDNMTIGGSNKIEPEFRFGNSDESHQKSEDAVSMSRIIKKAKNDSPIFDAEFKLGAKRTLTATIFLGAKSKSHHISIPIEDSNLQTYTWRTLPDSIRQQVLEAKNP